MSESEEGYQFERGQLVWVPDALTSWATATVIGPNEEKPTTHLDVIDATEHRATHQLSDVHPTNPTHQAGVPDCTQMMYLKDPHLLSNLRTRYENDQIYTTIAYILTAINPYKKLDIYGEKTMDQYKNAVGGLEPHIFATANRAYNHMRTGKRSQSMVVSGDSGAGKTVTCKHVLRYLVHIAGSASTRTLAAQILDANPVLEAFGNAKTLRNNNSSRFGKFTEIYFDTEGIISGAKITTHLLEKSRVVAQSVKERNFHVFYMMLAGATADERQRWGLKPKEDYHYLNKSGCYTVDGVDDSTDYKRLREAMVTCQLSSEDQEHVFATLAAILALGNVKFVEPDGNEAARVSPITQGDLDHASRLLGCQMNQLRTSLTSRTMTSGGRRGTVYMIPLRPDDAAVARDSLAKQIYSKLFDWLVTRINNSLPQEGISRTFIGLLDISGFEYFDRNGFEQFCINHTNEKIQQYFIRQILDTEQDIYMAEGLRWKKVDYKENLDTLNLVERKQQGILALLEEECIMPRTTFRTFTAKVHKHNASNPSLLPASGARGRAGRRLGMQADEGFVVKHFAADVTYSTQGFLERNNDTLHKDLIELMTLAAAPFYETLFEVHEDENAEETGDESSKNTRYATVSSRFQRELVRLLKRLSTTQSHFVRCINPNLTMSPGDIDAPYTMSQLKCSGMLEALVIMQAGFPTRCLFTDLYRRYKDYMPEFVAKLSPKLFSEALLVALDLEGGSDFQMGLTKVFFRSGKLAFLDDLLVGNELQMGYVVKKIRAWHARKRWHMFIECARGVNRLKHTINAIREKHLKAKMESEEYQAMIRKKEEEERKRLEEAARLKEEEAAKERQKLEVLRQEKIERKRLKQQELEQLREQVMEKMSLEEKIEQQKLNIKQVETNAREEIEELNNELAEVHVQHETVKSIAAEKSELVEVLTTEKTELSEALTDTRQKNTTLEEELKVAHARIELLKRLLQEEKDARQRERIEHDERLDYLRQKMQEEFARLNHEHERELEETSRQKDRTITALRREWDELAAKQLAKKQQEMDRLKLQMKEDAAKSAQEKEKQAMKPIKSGWLMKQGTKKGIGGLGGGWKKRWFVLKSNFLFYFAKPDDSRSLGVMDIESARVYKTAKACTFEIRVPTRGIVLRADSDEIVQTWMKAVNLAKARHLSSVQVDVTSKDSWEKSLDTSSPRNR